MAVLSLLRRKQIETHSPEDLLEAARGAWIFNQGHTLHDLRTYFEIETDPTKRKIAAIQFLSNVSILPHLDSEIRASRDIIRETLERQQEYDFAFLQNIVTWKTNIRKPSMSPDSEIKLCATRMLSIVSYFDEVSADAIEIAINFFLQALGDKETRSVSDTIWADCFTVAKLLILRRESASFAKEELLRLRDAVLLFRPQIALELQRAIAATK